MKRHNFIRRGLLLVLMIAMLSLPAYAAGTSLKIDAPASLPAVGETFTVKVDISGNPGLCAAQYTLAFDKTVVTCVSASVGDVLKGVVAVCLGRWLFGHLPADAAVSPYLGVYLAAILAVVGHSKPIYFGFKGGKGVLVAAGAILAVQPVLLPVLALIFLVCLVPTGMVSLGSITMAAAYPVLTLVYSLMRGLPTRDVVVCTVGAAIMGGMVIWMHRSNIQRIRDGKEYRFGQKHKSN